MNYAHLIAAIREDDKGKTDELLSSLFPVLVNYLRVTMNAGEKDAEDCAQEALITVVENIRRNGIKNPESIFNYIITVSRHAYLRLRRGDIPGNYVDFSEAYHVAEPAEQLDNLLDDERERFLEECIETLSKENRRMIEMWFQNPGRPSEEVARHFKISVNNVWIRKYRIIKILNKCIGKKMG
jgi:RNA polymerase sigma factor (sigma-70 family)